MALATMWYTIASVVVLIMTAAVFADPGPRQNGCSFTNNNRFYLLGGDGLNGTTYDPFVYTNFPLDLTKNIVWNNVTINGTFFSSPANQDVTTMAGYLKPCVVTPNGTLIVGGNDFIGYDIENDRWLGPLNLTGNVPSVLFLPCAKWGACSERVVQVDDSLWIFEDFATEGALPGTDIYILNLTTFSWTSRQQQTTLNNQIPNELQFTELYYVPARDIPLSPDGVIFMVGGSTAVGSTIDYSPSIWMFNITTLTWYLSPQGLQLGVDNIHLFYFPPTTTMFVFPGASRGLTGTQASPINVMQTLNLTLTQIYSSRFPQQNFQPSPRTGANVVQQGNTFVVYGGNNGSVNDDKFYIFNMEIEEWTQKALPTSYIATPITYWTPSPSPTGTSTITTTNTTSIPTGNNANGTVYSSNLGAIIGGTIGGVAAIAAVGIFFFACFCRRQRRRVASSNASVTHSFSDESTSFMRYYKNGSVTQLSPLSPYEGSEYAALVAPAAAAAMGSTLTRSMTGRNADEDPALANFGRTYAYDKFRSHPNKSFIVESYTPATFKIVPSPLPDSMPGSIVLTEIVKTKEKDENVEFLEHESEEERVWAGFGVEEMKRKEMNRVKARHLSIIERHPDIEEDNASQSPEVQHANYCVEHE